jgi:hypothetical protein
VIAEQPVKYRWRSTRQKSELTCDIFQCHWSLLVLLSRGALHADRGEGDCNRGEVRVNDAHFSLRVSSGSDEVQ